MKCIGIAACCFVAAMILVVVFVVDSHAATVKAATAAPTAVNYDEALAQKWERIATAERAKLVKHCKVLGKPLPAPMPVLIGDDLYGYAMACKAKADIWHARMVKLHHRLTHPGGSGAARWWPLASYVGWPAAQKSMLLKVIWRESNGQPRCFTPPYGAAGLMQFIKPWWSGQWSLPAFNPYDPEVNLTMGLRLWRMQGWRPWSLTAW